MDAEQLFFDICHIMDDFGDTHNQIITSYMEANEDLPSEAGGGKRKSHSICNKRKHSKQTGNQRGCCGFCFCKPANTPTKQKQKMPRKRTG